MTSAQVPWHAASRNRSTFALKLIGILFAMIVLPLTAYFLVSYRTTEQAILASASLHSLEMLHDQRDYLALQLDQINALAENLGQIDEINSTLAKYDRLAEVSAVTTLATNEQISHLLSSYRNLDRLVAIDVFSLNGTRFHVGDSLSESADWSFLRQDLWDRTMRSPGRLNWHGVEDNAQKNPAAPKVILATRLLWNPEASWLLISYSVNFFYEHFSKVNVGRNAYLMVLDERRRLIYHPDPAKIGRTIASDFSALLQGPSGSFLQRIGRDEVLLSYEHIQDKDWYIVSIVPKATLLASMGRIRTVGWSMLGISAVLAFFLMRYFMLRVVAPLGAIAEGFRAFQLDRLAEGWRMETPKAMTQIVDLVIWFNAFLESVERSRKAEEETRSLNAELETRVRNRTRDLALANDRLLAATHLAEAANRTKSQFLANMSHELRTPLNAILGFSQILRRNRDLGEKDRAFVGRILRSGEHLLGLINEVLSIAKIESGTLTLNPAPFQLSRLVQELQELIAVRAGEKGLALDVRIAPQVPDQVLGDEGKLRQVLINLLGNAVKFTGQGEVGLRVELREGKVRFEVRDTGPGLHPGELDKLFLAFQQAEAGQKAKEGTGLGLYISQAMVRLMGGEIRVRSEPGVGSSFQFELALPVLEARAAAPGEVRMVQGLVPDQAGAKALVVDDRVENRDLLAELLTQWGFEVRTAEDGAAALEVWAAWDPAVVWMDLVMPGLSGSEAVARIRDLERTTGRSRTLVIALSASALDLDREAIQAQGFDEFVLKPFREHELVEPLERLGGLRFRAEETPADAKGSLAAGEFRGLARPWCATFRKALLLGDLDQAAQCVAALEEHPLAASLKAMVLAYRFEELLKLMEESGMDHE